MVFCQALDQTLDLEMTLVIYGECFYVSLFCFTMVSSSLAYTIKNVTHRVIKDSTCVVARIQRFIYF